MTDRLCESRYTIRSSGFARFQPHSFARIKARAVLLRMEGIRWLMRDNSKRLVTCPASKAKAQTEGHNDSPQRFGDNEQDRVSLRLGAVRWVKAG